MSTSLDNLPPPSAVPVSASGSGSNTSLMDANANYNPNIVLPPVGADGGSGSGNGGAMDVNTIQELVQGLQQANASGATSLPVRDIPQSTTSVVADEQAKPNYVPTNRRVRFEEEDDDEMEYERTAKKQSAMNRRIETANSIYDELQIPILLAILYFVFQLPVIRLFLYKHLPMLFESVGAGVGLAGSSGMQMNLIGLCLTSAVFGFGYLFLSKIMAYLSSF